MIRSILSYKRAGIECHLVYTLCIPCVYLKYTLCVSWVFRNTQAIPMLYLFYTKSIHK